LDKNDASSPKIVINDLSDADYDKIGGGKVSMSDLADKLSIPEDKRKLFYRRLWLQAQMVHPFD
jgi:hypothetical protein